MGRTLLNGWYGPDAMRTSHYYIPFDDWRALIDTLLAMADPRLAPFWLFAVGGGWALARADLAGTRRQVALLSLLAVLNVVIFWVLIPYRTQQRFMLQALGLAVVPLAVVLDRLHWLRPVAVLLLLLHIFTPECWPLALREDEVPWDLSPHVPNAIGAPMPLLGRLEAVLRGDTSLDSLLILVILLAICATGILAIWAWERALSIPTRRLRDSPIALALTAALLVLGYFDARPRAFDRRFDFYPFYTDFIRGWLELEARFEHNRANQGVVDCCHQSGREYAARRSSAGCPDRLPVCRGVRLLADRYVCLCSRCPAGGGMGGEGRDGHELRATRLAPATVSGGAGSGTRRLVAVCRSWAAHGLGGGIFLADAGRRFS